MSFKRIGQAATLDKQKWVDFLINGGIFILSALVTYVADNIGQLDLGEWGLIIAPAIALGIKYLQKFVDGLRKKEEVQPKPTPPSGPDFPVT